MEMRSSRQNGPIRECPLFEFRILTEANTLTTVTVVEDRYLVHDGDLLFGWSGNRGTSFGPFRWSRNEVCALNQHIFRVVPRAIGKQALYWILKAVTAHVEDQAHGIIGMVHITKGDLGAINVPVPEPFEQ